MESKPVTGFDENSSREVADARTAASTTYANTDGTTTVVQSSMPVHFQDGDGVWQDVDNRIVTGADGVLSNAANAWQVSFSPMSPDGGVAFRAVDGQIRFNAVGAVEVKPVIEPDGESVRYVDVFPGMDVVYRVTGMGVEELLVLKTADAPPVVSFHVQGASFERGKFGGLTARDSTLAGKLNFSAPETYLATGTGVDVANQVFDVMDDGSGGSIIQVGLRKEALASLTAESFPVTVDPSLTYGSSPSWVHSYAADTSNGASYATYNDGYARIGNPYLSASSPIRWRSVAFMDYSALYGANIVDASVTTNVVDGYAAGAQPLNAFWASQDGFHYGTTPKYYTSASPSQATVAYGWHAYLESTVTSGWSTASGSLSELYNVLTRTSSYGAALYFGGSGAAAYTFKKFSVSLSLTYNRWPSAPTGSFSASGRTASFASAYSWDPDGDATRFMYRLVDQTTGATIDSYGGGEGQFTDWTSTTSFTYQVPQDWSGHLVRAYIYAWDSVCVVDECHVSGTEAGSWTAVNAAPGVPALDSPVNGFQSHNLTVTLKAFAGSDSNAVPPQVSNGDSMYYAFYYCTSNPCGSTRQYFTGWQLSTWPLWAQTATFPTVFYSQTVWWGVDVYDGRDTAGTAMRSITLTNAAPTATNQAPGNGTVTTLLTTQTPTLTATVADADDPITSVSYNFVLTPTGGSGILAQSGWLGATGSAVSFKVPAWLQSDTGYDWHVDVRDQYAATGTSTPWRLSPQSRLGADGASPMQTSGPVSVNMATGNLFVAAGAGNSVATVGGAMTVGMSYNSQDTSMLGLRGVYYVDANNNGVPDTGEVKLVRTDSTPSFNWGGGAPAASVPADFSVQWKGALRVPTAGSWQFAGGHDDNLKITVVKNGVPVVVYNTTCCLGPGDPNVFTGSTAIYLDPAVDTVTVQIDYRDTGGGAYTEFRAARAGMTESSVAADWFGTGDSQALPVGWTLSADTGLDSVWSKATPTATGVTLTAVDGSQQAWTKTTTTVNGAAVDSWLPPIETDDVLSVNTDQTITVHSAGLIYRFAVDGTLTDVSTAADDLKPAGGERVYSAGTTSTEPMRLVSVRDRLVTSRQITLRYNQAGLGPCPTVPAGFDTAPPAGMLCAVDYPDGTSTRLFYQSGLLARISAPGDETSPTMTAAPEGRAVTDLTWTAGQLTTVITATDNDRIAAQTAVNTSIPAGQAIPAADLATTITWTANKPTAVTLPRPQAGADRPANTFTYNPAAATATMTVAGLSGVARTVGYDTIGRTVTNTDAAGRTATTQWSPAGDFVLWNTSGGRTSTTVYDRNWHPLDTYGPAPTACFTFPTVITATTNGPAPTVSNSGCGLTQVPHTATSYDTNLAGLTGAVWNNPTRSGPTSAHRMAPGTSIEYNDTPTGVPPTGWSARYTGLIVPPSTGTYILSFGTANTTTATLYLNDTKFAALTGNQSAQITFGITTGGAHTDPVTHLPANLDPWRIRIDVSTTTATENVSLWWQTPGSGSFVQIPNTAVRPGFFYPTSTTVDDTTASTQVPATTTTIARYDEGIDASYGLVTSTTVDPAGLALTTSNGYEPATPGSLLRQTRRTLPAYAGAPTTANSTTTSYYPITATVADPCIAGSSAVNQAGLTQYNQDPTSAAGAAVTIETVYDTLGRPVATRYTTDSMWTCTRYDARNRPTQTTYPAAGTAPARTVTYTYAVTPNPSLAGDPYSTAINDTNGTITTTTDALGRTVSYTDASAQTTTTSYDQAGRAINQSGSTGATSFTYDSVGRAVTQSLDGSVIATPTYSPDTDPVDPGKLIAVTYPAGTGNAGNGTSGSFTYDTLGRNTGTNWNQGAITLTSDAVTRTLTGRVLTDTGDGAGTPTWTYTYDGAARLTRAVGSGHDYQYGFAATGGCGTNTAAGKNTDRTTVTDNGVVTQTSCFDASDRITNYTIPGATITPTYDNRGRTTSLNGDTYSFDPANRHIGTVNGPTTVTYTRDASNRIIARTDTATGNTIRYGFTGPGDTPDITLDTTGTVVVEKTIGLPGGVTVTKRAGGDVWSYPNIHGDITAVADATGVKQGATSVYNPSGEIIGGTLVDNSADNYDYGWLGQHQRGTEHATGLNTNIEMGARIYNPKLARFLTIDPVPGGSANNYDYTNADPINGLDLDGLCWKWNVACKAAHSAKEAAKATAHGVATAAKTTASAVNKAYQHTEFSVSACVGICLGLGMQGGHVFGQGGAGCCFASGNVGIARKQYKDRRCSSHSITGAYGPVGGYVSVGARGAMPDWSDVSGGYSYGAGFGTAWQHMHEFTNSARKGLC